ncbi:MAG: CRISPR-associated endonuclease Cas1 [Patescibacteria group bacterium]|nr:CRISPR-associated endonuclease Cas1 [Patescibacteria group bacterium]
MNLYLVSQGSKVGIKDGRVYVETPQGLVKDYPSLLIENIFVFGNIFLTTQALKFFLKNQIRVIFLSALGDYIGSLVSIDQKNIFLKYSQYEVFKNEKKRLRLSKNLLRNKINSQREVIYTSAKNQKKIDLYENFVNRVDCHIEKIDSLSDVSQARGLEGIVQKEYYEVFSQLIINPAFRFIKRSHYPPTDEINSLLSFGYTLLVNLATGFIVAKNLDPYISFFHQNQYRRENLSLDIIEPFRPFVDRLVLNLINLKMINENDFERKENKVLIKENAIRLFFYQFQKRFIENQKFIQKMDRLLNSVVKFIQDEKDSLKEKEK